MKLYIRFGFQIKINSFEIGIFGIIVYSALDVYSLDYFPVSLVPTKVQSGTNYKRFMLCIGYVKRPKEEFKWRKKNASNNQECEIKLVNKTGYDRERTVYEYKILCKNKTQII